MIAEPQVLVGAAHRTVAEASLRHGSTSPMPPGWPRGSSARATAMALGLPPVTWTGTSPSCEWSRRPGCGVTLIAGPADPRATGLTACVGLGVELFEDFPEADIGYKVPGIHWSMTNPTHPRAAEVTTGLIQTSVDLDSWATGHGYQRVVELANRFDGGPREVVLHFTALEMDDDPVEPAYSLAQTLVGWIGDYAYRAGVELKGARARRWGRVRGGLGQHQRGLRDVGLPRADRAPDR